jgi:hypothetical protein
VPTVGRCSAQRAVLILLAILAAAFGVGPELGRVDAARLADLAADRAFELRYTDPSAAAMYAVGASRFADTAKTRATLASVQQSYRYLIATAKVPGGQPSAVATDPSAGLLFVFGGDENLHVLSMSSGQRLRAVAVAVDDPITAATFDGPLRTLLAGDSSGQLYAWRVDAHGRPGPRNALGSLGALVAGIGISADGSLAFAVDVRGSARVIRLSRTDPPEAGAQFDLGTSLIVCAVADEMDLGSGATVLVATEHAGVLGLSVPDDADVVPRVTVVVPPPQKTVLRMAAFGTGGVAAVVLATDDGAYVWQRNRLRELELPGGYHVPHAVMFSEDGAIVQFATDAGVVLVPITAATTSLPATLDVTRPYVGRTALMTPILTEEPAGDQTMFAVSAHGVVGKLSLSHDQAGLPPARASTAMVFDPDGSLLLTDPFNNTNLAMGIYAIRVEDGPMYDERFDRFDYSIGRTYGVDGTEPFFVADIEATERYVVAAVHGTDLYVWNRNSAELVAKLALPGVNRQAIADVTLLSELRLLVGQDTAGNVAAWSLDTWQLQFSLTLRSRANLTADPYHPRILIALTAGADGYDMVEIDLDSGGVVGTRPAPTGVFGIFAAPDRQGFLAVTQDGALLRLDRQRQPVGMGMPLGGTSVTKTVLSPDHASLATAFSNGHVTVTDLADSITVTVADLSMTGLIATGIQWAPSGRYLALEVGTRMNGGLLAARVLFVGVDPAEWLANLCQLAAPAFAAGVWARFTTAVPGPAVCSASREPRRRR